MQSNLNNFAKEFYSASSVARLYASSFANISNAGIASALKAQMSAYKSIAPASNSLEQVFKLTKPINESLVQFNSKVVQNYMSSQTTKQIESINRRLQRSIPTAGFNQTAAINKALRKTMEPLFNSGNLKTMTAANSILNKISANPYNSYKALQKAINNQTTPGLKELDKAVRNQIKDIEEEYGKSQTASDSDSRVIDTENSIKELQNTVKVDKKGTKHIEFSIEYFELMFQIIATILVATGFVKGDKGYELLGFIIESIDHALNIHFINQDKD